jgi:D-amino-acid dehydrogenase
LEVYVAGKAIVIGGGAIGVASAYYLGQSGWQVTVIDSGEVGKGCSYGNLCLITPCHSHSIAGPGVIAQAIRWMLKGDSPFFIRPSYAPKLIGWGLRFRRYCTKDAAHIGFDALVSLSRLSLELYVELSQKLDFFFERKGLLHVYLTEKGFEGAKAQRDTFEATGFGVSLLDKQKVLDFEPALSDRVRGGLFIEGEAHGHSFNYVRALAQELKKTGTTFLENRPVSRILVDSRRAKSVLVTSPEEEITADVIVLAAGSWTPSLAKSAGIFVPLQPAKGYSCTIDTYPGAPSVPLLMPETRVIVTPIQDRLRFGGTLELAGFDLSLNETRYQAVIRGARAVLRHPFEMKNEESWCGLRPVLPDGLPIIGRVPHIDGLIMAAGHAMLGFTQSPATGKIVSEIADGQTPSVPIEAFRFERF